MAEPSEREDSSGQNVALAHRGWIVSLLACLSTLTREVAVP